MAQAVEVVIFDLNIHYLKNDLKPLILSKNDCKTFYYHIVDVLFYLDSLKTKNRKIQIKYTYKVIKYVVLPLIYRNTYSRLKLVSFFF